MQIMTLTRAFILLIALSLATTVVTHWATGAGPLFVVAVLLLSGLKARVILLDYLGLRNAPSFRGGFVTFLVAFLVLAFGLYFAGGV